MSNTIYTKCLGETILVVCGGGKICLLTRKMELEMKKQI